MDYSFGKNHRIKSRTTIKSLFKNSNLTKVDGIKLHWNTSPSEPCLEFVVSVPKRNIPSAVQRNKIKRLIREAIRLNKNTLEKHVELKSLRLSIFIIYTGNPIKNYQKMEDKIIVALQRLTVSLDLKYNEK